MFRVRIDRSGKYGRYFRPVAATLVVVFALLFAVRESLARERDHLAILALLGAAAVGALAVITKRP